MSRVRVKDLVDVARSTTYGGKAVTLSRLLRAGLPVPQGIVVPAGLALYSEESRMVISDFIDRFVPRTSIAVRSSAVGEDGRNASHAGRYESVLGCYTEKEVLHACVLVRLSAKSARATEYRKRQGSSAPVQVGVLIQPVVEATHAAVVFTKHPMPNGPSNRDDVVVEIVRGPGDQLVSGRTEPSTWEYGTDDGLWAHRAGPTIEIPERQTLLTLALRCAEVIKAPADVEAVFDGVEWWIVQARPITTLPKQTRKKKP